MSGGFLGLSEEMSDFDNNAQNDDIQHWYAKYGYKVAQSSFDCHKILA